MPTELTPYTLANEEGGGVCAAAGLALVRLSSEARGSGRRSTMFQRSTGAGGFNSAATVLRRSLGLAVRQKTRGLDHYMGFLQIVKRCI